MLNPDFSELTANVKQWGQALGFQQVGITDTDLGKHERHFTEWLARGFHADMDYMSRHGTKRSRPAELLPGTTSIISVRMDYWPQQPLSARHDPERACVARYALGRDYHKVIRGRLRKLELRINDYLQDHDMTGFAARVFTDSAPVLERGIAEKAGLGWIGKNTLLINEKAGSWFFLGEIYTNIPLIQQIDVATNRCGSCTACMDVCPTNAIVGPYQLDARKCISYHTIENKGAIPVSIRENMGNRVFGCDDCQDVCPWNRYASPTEEVDFSPRNDLDSTALLTLFAWGAEDFDQETAGSAIRRVGYDGWRRNIAVALGNSPYGTDVLTALSAALVGASAMLKEHLIWAIERQQARKQEDGTDAGSAA